MSTFDKTTLMTTKYLQNELKGIPKVKEKLLLVGAGGFGRVASETAVLNYDCAFVDDGVEKGTEICGVEVIGNTSDLPTLFGEYKKLIVTIGNNRVRESIYNIAVKIGYEFPNLVHPSVYISPYAKIGWGCVFLNHVTVQNGSVVGNGVLLNPGVEIHHDCSVDDFDLIYTNSVVRTYAKVGKRVRIGSNVTISNDAVVPDDADIPNCTAIK